MTEQRNTSPGRCSTDALSGPEGWDAWRDSLTPLFDIKGEGEKEAFRARLDGFDLGMMFVAQIAFSGMQQTGVRSKELINRTGLDHYAVELCLATDGYVWEGRGRAADIEPGDILVLDLSQANVMVAANSTSLTLTVPRVILDRHCPGVEDLHGVRLTQPGLSGILRDHMLSLYRHLPHMAVEDADATAEATIRLLGACLAPSAERLSRAGALIDRSLFDRAIRYIDERVGDPALTPAAICAAAGISRSNLYRLFRESGGVSRCIQERRLRRAHAALCDPDERRSISEVAYACGFKSAAHFSRAFRRLVGCSPRDARERARASASGLAAGDGFAEAWLNGTRGR